MRPLIIRITLEIYVSLLKLARIIFTRKKRPLLIIIEKRIRNESCALVYRMIPAYVLMLRKTKLLSILKIKIFLLSSGKSISSALKLYFKKYAKQRENMQTSRSRQKMIQRGTILMRLNKATSWFNHKYSIIVILFVTTFFDYYCNKNYNLTFSLLRKVII